MKADDFRDLKKPRTVGALSAPEVQHGMPIHPVMRVELFSDKEWEIFIEEWAGTLTGYYEVKRYGGAGDKGCDVVGFVDANKWTGVWDNYQCKHYNSSLAPVDIWKEIGKIIYYSFSQEYNPPRKCYFAAPKGIGTKLSKLFDKPAQLKKECLDNWESYCRKGITLKEDIGLEGELLKYFNDFDFSIFDGKKTADLIEQHIKCSFHAIVFGGGLPERPPITPPPGNIQDSESRYIEQLLKAYSDNLKRDVQRVSELEGDLKEHFNRSRETFYHAESLKNFSRDIEIPGTFSSLQDDIYHGVVDTCQGAHGDALAKVRATVTKSGELDLASNTLHARINIKDRHGICHQLVNDKRIHWVKDK